MEHDKAAAVLNGVPHVVGDHQRGQPLLCNDPIRQLHDLGGGFGIQRGGVLVQQQQLGTFQRRHQQRQRLTLTAGQGADLGGEPGLQPQSQIAQQRAVGLSLLLGDAPAKAALLPAACRQRQIFLDVYGGRCAHHGVLKHAANVGGPFVLRKIGHVDAVKEHLAGIHL